MKRRNLMMNRIAATTFAIILTVGMLAGVQRTAITVKAATNYGISGPTKDADGNVVYDRITFGNYWQEDTNGDGITNKQDDKTPIKWRVLSVNGDDAFLVADQILDFQRYNDTYEGVTWENCTMRSWLNGYGKENNICEKDYTAAGASFMSNAFTDDEQVAIAAITIENKDNQYYGTEGGNETTDQIFLLSLEDMTKLEYGFEGYKFIKKEYYGYGEHDYYNIYNYATLRTVTAFAGGPDCRNQDKLDTATGDGGCDYIGNNDWWLRSPGENGSHPAHVCSDGRVEEEAISSSDVSGSRIGVVPALHLNLSSMNEWKKVESVVCTGKGIRLTTIENQLTHTHTWDAGKITRQATETATGVMTYKCSDCSEIKTEVLPKLTSQKPSNNYTGNRNNNTATVSKVSSFKATAKKKALSISWKKVTGASGYELQYSTKSNFKGAKTKKLSSSKKSYTIRKLKAKKKYYVRIRAYNNYKDAAGKTKKAVGTWVKVNKKTK